MDAIRRRLRDDWRGHFHGELHLDAITRTLYATDASLFQIEPVAVAVPRDLEDLQFLVRYAGDQQLTLMPRGGGTGVAGESLGPGIAVDMSVHFRGILDVGLDSVRVQPGVTLRSLNQELAKNGRRFGPDTASAASCTVGGMLATNASGSNVMVHGYTRDHVRAIRAVFDSGDVGDVERPAALSSPDESRFGILTSAIGALLDRHADAIRSSRPRTPYDRCGYLLHDVLTPLGPDLTKLLVGSEGTLALFAEATLQTVPLPGGRAAVLLGFDRFDDALAAALHVRPLVPSACEMLDRRLLSLTRAQSPDAARLIPAATEAILLVEIERDSADDAKQAVLELIETVQRTHHLATHVLPAFDRDAIARLWQVREAALPALYSLGKGARPLAFIEDVGVPPESLPEYISKLQGILHRFETTASFMIHAATGQVHARPFLDPALPADADKLWAIAEQTYALVHEMGGTISTQHGTGIARTPWVEKQVGPLLPIFREIKALFDPRGLFNPGKIVGIDPSRPAWPLRQSPAPPAKPVRLLWEADELACQTSACNGCGSCRTEDTHQRMCPTFRVTHEEAASPRAKANLLRSLLAGNATLGAGDVRQVADLCINCKMCAIECPAHVNIPKLMIETKAANLAEHGLDRSDWLLARIESAAALGSNFALVSNTLVGSRPFRWLAEKVFGIARQRRMPTFAARTFLKRAKRRGWTQKSRSRRSAMKVAYFVDLFPNVFDPLIAEAVVAVMQHHGVEVYVPPDQKACGMAPLSQGDVELARDVVRHNLRLLAELARDGYTILCSEPTAAVMLRQDAVDLLDDPEAKIVARHVEELTSFLWRMHENGRLRTDFQRVDVSLGHHVPCHVKALGAGVHGPDLLSLVPGIRVHTIDVSCSGMAGTYGLKAKNFRTSLEAGRPMLDEMARPRVLYGSTECGSCRMQMEQGSGKRTLHPVQYLAMAYGLLPQIERKLREPLRDLVN